MNSISKIIINKSVLKNGFTLLEVLISTVVLTISLLGVAGMYGFSSRFSYEARQYTQALNVANQIIERIKINKAAWINGVFLKESNKDYKLIIINEASEKQTKQENILPCESDMNSCRDSQIMALDINDFESHLSSVFPSSFAEACIRMMKTKDGNFVNVDLDLNWSLVFNESPNNLGHCDLHGETIKNYHITTML